MIRAIVLAIGLLAIPASAWALSPRLDRLEWGAYEALPHGEPDVLNPSDGNIARSALMAGGALSLGRVSLDVDMIWWGIQPWRAPEVVGSGLNAWLGTDWKVREWAWQGVAELRVRLNGWASACVRHEDGARRPYYWLVGICGRIR